MLYKNKKGALIGLIILFAISIVMAGGRKPLEIYPATKITELTPEEMRVIDNAYLQSVKEVPSGEESPRSWYRFEPHPLLAKVFPQVKFYYLFSGMACPPFSHLKAEFKGNFYSLPGGFNRLLLDNGLEVNEKNIIELAKAFVVIASGELRFSDVPIPKLFETVERERYTRGFPQITFLEGKRIKNFREAKKINKSYQKLMVTDFTYRAYLKIKIGEEVQDWYFGVNPQDSSQFGVVNIGIPATGEFHLRYNLFQGERKPKGKSWDTNPQIHIDSLFGGVYLEKCGDTLRYYLIVSENGGTIHDSVHFFLIGFPPDSHNVYIGLTSKNPSYAQYFLLQRVDINSDSTGEYVWHPTDSLTGITWVTAGYADTSDPINSYRPVTQQPYEELTLEKVITGRFHNAYPDTFTVYYTDRFFVNHDSGISHSSIFAERVKRALIESWQKQVIAYFSKVLIEDRLNFKPLLITISEDGIL